MPAAPIESAQTAARRTLSPPGRIESIFHLLLSAFIAGRIMEFMARRGQSLTKKNVESLSFQDFAQERKNGTVELPGSLTRREMTHAGQNDKRGRHVAPREISGVPMIHELIGLGQEDRHRHADI